MGKGSKPRPVENKEKFASNWDNIFKRGKSDESDKSRARHTGVADKPSRVS
jgi:hypothetical protein